MDSPHEENQTIAWVPNFDVAATQSKVPERIGRYRVTELLGAGGFGEVYLAHDDDLDRWVAVKIPRSELVGQPEGAELYLKEAKIAASLDHPNIVEIYDVGSSEAFPCYTVSKYIRGTTLAARMDKERIPTLETTELVAAIADALHHAHTKWLVHRDVKPENILINLKGKPYITDFGLALRERDFGTGPNFCGTPAYMSPEQAMGEGHHVDPRSDVFSLGVVLYELLVGRRPFSGKTTDELLTAICSQEPTAPRQSDDRISRELERICLKALSKRRSDRYDSADQMADDLRVFCLSANSELQERLDDGLSTVQRSESETADRQIRPSAWGSGSKSVDVIPRGLSAYTHHDAEFFLSLLPGPTDRNGLPDSLRFWKSKLEETNDAETFEVGLLYGCSGSGKSSFVKAGLLPHIEKHVVCVYVECTGVDTESRILAALRRECPELPTDLGLRESLHALRHGKGLWSWQKIVIVLDQFEQWLHASRGEQDRELAAALRQCNGGRVQCLLLVRDDFWMAISRFLRELEIPLLEGRNSAAIDLFDEDHARKVLIAFGRAYKRLPERGVEMTPPQREFVDRVVEGLAENGQVICVQLALCGEMLRSREWIPSTLEKLGGTRGIGEAFLDETFCGKHASPERRFHERNARAALKALLPEPGTNIKGHMRSIAELRKVLPRQADDQFDGLLRVLDTDLRLITPTEPVNLDVPSAEDLSGSADVENGSAHQPKYYQLTHDYLVPSLRAWLERKQRETPQGRAALKLVERTQSWRMKQDARQLPSLREFLSIRRHTRVETWTNSQRAMMSQAKRHHAWRLGVGAASLSAVLAVVLMLVGNIARARKTEHAKVLVEQLVDVDAANVPGIVRELRRYQTWADPLIEARIEHAAFPAKLRYALALADRSGSHRRLVMDGLSRLPLHEIVELCSVLQPATNAERIELWKIAETNTIAPSERFAAASALAMLDNKSNRWNSITPFIVEQLVRAIEEDPSSYKFLVDQFAPVAGDLIGSLLPPARAAAAGRTRSDTAFHILLDYAQDDSRLLADILASADRPHFLKVFEALRTAEPSPAAAAEALRLRMWDETDEAEAARRANLCVALLRLQETSGVWRELRQTANPTVRSLIIDRCAKLGVPPDVFAHRFTMTDSVSEQRALLLCLGEYDENRLAEEDRISLRQELFSVFHNHSDAGLHSAAQWLLETWGHSADAAVRISRPQPHGRNWTVDPEGFTMVRLDATTFVMGSPPSEVGRDADESPHRVRLDREFAISATEVTNEQFQRFIRSRSAAAWAERATEDSQMAPRGAVSWYSAAAYCNWLSRQAGIPETEWCYQPNADGEFAEGMRVVDGYLKLRGYRLPTDAEWEFACRAGSSTIRFHGAAEGLLHRYAWHEGNADKQGHPVGRLRPNDFGLFDVYGNVAEWCHDEFDENRIISNEIADTPPAGIVTNATKRVLRGGSYIWLPRYCRSANRYGSAPSLNNNDVGFRVARSIHVGD